MPGSCAMFDDPFTVDGHELFITASCGLVLAGPEDTPMTVLRDADAAMYRAKDLGRARIELFNSRVSAAGRAAT